MLQLNEFGIRYIKAWEDPAILYNEEMANHVRKVYTSTPDQFAMDFSKRARVLNGNIYVYAIKDSCLWKTLEPLFIIIGHAEESDQVVDILVCNKSNKYYGYFCSFAEHFL